jgi:competence protein ComEC
MPGVRAGIRDALAARQGSLYAFVPVLIGCAIGAWFAWPTEPPLGVYLLAAAVAVTCLSAIPRAGDARPVVVAVLCLSIGVLACGVRLWSVSAPVLDTRYYGPITGRVILIDRSQSDALRVTLDQVQLLDLGPGDTPARVRLSVQEDQPHWQPEPGQMIMTTGHLAAPEGPVEPGGFDFARMAYFDRLGGVGYTRNPVVLWDRPQGGALWINRTRTYLAGGIMAAIPGDPGAFAAGVMTGDRSGLSAEAVAALRDSSLAHLLAISGMNMVFLVGFVFALIRYGLALVPPLALRVNAKKIAAVLALGVAAFYLMLSGANVATERAFIMVAVMLGAVLLDRRAVSLRSVAVAGTLILLYRPESLTEPGFQMSFAATVALIVAFRAIDAGVMRERLPWWMIPVFTLVLSSVVGGFATAPYAAAHFNRFSDYGLIANLLTVPVMGAIVMPAGAMAALLAPFGLAAPALWVMEQGCRWILWVAFWVAGWEGSVTAIPAPGPLVLPVLTLGAVWIVGWQGRGRWAGAVVVAGAMGLWAAAPRPEVLISGDGGLVGLMGTDGRALSSARGAGFAARQWLENDGDLAAPADAADRAGFTGPPEARSFAVAGWRGVVIKGRDGSLRAEAACRELDLVVTTARATATGGCLMLDAGRLSDAGPVALTLSAQGVTMQVAQPAARAWTRRVMPLDAVVLTRGPRAGRDMNTAVSRAAGPAP